MHAHKGATHASHGWPARDRTDGERANARAKGCNACVARAARERCPGPTVSGRTPAQKEAG
jgi:hypothetical protein